MPAPIAAKRWEAAHDLMCGEPPTQLRVAVAMGIHKSAITKKAARDGWVLPDHRLKQVRARHKEPPAHSIVSLPPGPPPAEFWGAPGGGAAIGPDAAPDVGFFDIGSGAPEASLDEQLARLGRMLSRQLERTLSAADAAGGLMTKAQADALAVTVRLVEKFGALASEHAADKQTGSDDELANILSRVDGRIVELARDYAARLGAGEPDA